jgi:CubicO group peptidase (beta-lactamase class C family)
VVAYLPYFRLDDARYTRITVRELLSHTAGLPDVQDYQWNRPENDNGALDRYVRGLDHLKLLWDPGTRFAYSNIGFEILGDIIARVSGMTFEDYIASHILAPLGRSTSTLLHTNVDTTLLAQGYTRPRDEPAGPFRRVTYPFSRKHGPSSDLFSSVVDMSRWARANLNRGELDGRRILDSAAYDVLWRPVAPVEFCRPPEHTVCRATDSSVGLSWFLQKKDGRLIVSHGGGDDGFISQLVMIPDAGFAFIMMTNSDVAGIGLLKDIQAQALTLVTQ